MAIQRVLLGEYYFICGRKTQLKNKHKTQIIWKVFELAIYLIGAGSKASAELWNERERENTKYDNNITTN